ncbi:MAG TPA: prenyltransferase [Clostridia bacterium]|nr:prenyltransferase [Clostridia bacterium]
MREWYQDDIQTLLAKRRGNGGELWATPEGSLIKGSPFTTLECAAMLAELGMGPDEPVLRATAALIFAVQRPDGRFKLTPQGAIYPCHTIGAARTLCLLGYAADERLRKTFSYLLDTQYGDGGWRCNKFSFGRGPETEFSNPGPTLTALDVFRHTDLVNHSEALERAVEFLLAHWRTRLPLGPCHYGIGTLFMQVAYPFSTYNLFFYVYVLSFYDRAKEDARFLEALAVLEAKLLDGRVVVERPNQRLAGLSFCKKGQPSELATLRYLEIRANLGRNA